MMTNLLNGAHVANKLFSTIARLRLLLVMLVMIFAATNMWGAVLFHETFGTNTGSVRDWNNSYSVKSGQENVYSSTTYTMTNAGQSKNTVGYNSTSGLSQRTQNKDAVFELGALNVSNYKDLVVTYYWKAGSIKGTYTTKLYYKTSKDGQYFEVTKKAGTGATTFVQCTYELPQQAECNTLYLKVIFNTSNTQACIDEFEITGNECSTKPSVTLQPNGGTGTAKVLATTDGSLTLPECDFTYEGYRFVGWNTKAEGTGTTYQPSAKYTPTENPATLYAKWAKEYTVTYNANGGTTTCEDNNKYIAGEQVTVCTSAPTRDSYTFNGWSYSPNVAITDGQFAMPENDVTITAQWTSNKTTTSLSWSADTYSATIDAANDFPTLTIDPEAIKESVQYTSSDETIATIDANGNITLLKKGETTITTTFEETATHTGATDSYTLTVNPSNCRWVEAEIGDIQSGDEVVITMTDALSNSYTLLNFLEDKEVPDAIIISSTNSFIDDYIWIVGKDGENLTFESYKNRGDFLRCNNADKGIRIDNNATANRKFVVDDTYGYLKNTQTTKPRYLGVHNEDYTWYSYAFTDKGNFPTKIVGQTLKFYKKTCLPADKYWVNYNLSNVTCITNPKPISVNSSDSELRIFFEPVDSYQLPKEIEVKMGEQILDEESYTWDNTNGKFVIEKSEDISFSMGDVTISIIACKSMDDPADLRANVTSTTATLSWSTVENAQNYTLLVISDNDDISYSYETTLSETTCLIEGLTPNTTYLWEVVANGVDGYCDTHTDVIFTTLDVYTVTFTTNGGTDVESQTVDHGTKATKPIDPTKIGYTFAGWYTEADTEFNFNTPITSATTLYAKWNANQYTITFSKQWGDGGTGTATVHFNNNDFSVNPITVPIRNGYTFGGYYTSESGAGTQLIDVSGAWLNAPTYIEGGKWVYADNLTLYAKWTQNFTITWMANGQPYHSQTAMMGTAIAKPDDPDEFACDDKVFVGWLDKTISGSTNEEPTFVTDFGTIQAAKTYYAVFATLTGTPSNDYNKITNINDLTDGEYVIAYGYNTTSPSIILTAETRNETTLVATSATPTNNKYTSPAAANIWEIKKTGTTYTLFNAATSQYIQATNNPTLELSNSNPTEFQISYSTDHWKIKLNDATTYQLVGYTNSSGNYFQTKSGASNSYKVQLYKNASTAVYSDYITTCVEIPTPHWEGAEIDNADIAVDCGTISYKTNASTITFPTDKNYDLTYPITLTASEGFLLSTNKQNDVYEQSVTVTPVQSDENKGKITQPVYVRADATGKKTNFDGTITISGDQLAEDQIIEVHAVVYCPQYTLTFKDCGDTKTITDFAGTSVEEMKPWAETCSEPFRYVFDGWATAPVTNGTEEYEKVDFSTFTMPNNNTTILYAVYRYAEEGGEAVNGYVKVTKALTDWSGDYVIVDDEFNVAIQNTYEEDTKDNKTLKDVSVTIENDKIVSPTNDIIWTISKSGEYYTVYNAEAIKYAGITKNATRAAGLSETIATGYSMNIIFDSNTKIAKVSSTDYNRCFSYSEAYPEWRTYSNNDANGKTGYLYRFSEKTIRYTSSLVCGSIEAENAIVTSTVGQTIKVYVPITLDSSTGATTINATSDNAAFAVTGLIDVEAGNHTIVVEYTPAEYNITETANITLSATNGATTTFTVIGRSLPEKFAIVAEKDGKYYALPADMPSAGTYAGYEVEVKDNTVVTAPDAYVYSLNAVHNSRYADYGTAVRFVGNEDKCLWASISKNAPTSIRNYAGIDNAKSEQYEWTLTTQDGETYTITSTTTAGRQLRLNATNFGLYASGVNNFRFLPIQVKTYEPVSLSSKFSVAKDKKVQFSAGNLQYHTGDKAWRFAEQQYYYVGDNNKNISNPEFKDWIDMFGWSADGKFGVNTSIDNNDYQGEFVDWGTLFPDEWYTLSMNEWYYLLNTRTNAANLKQLAKIGDVYGVLLFPDDWTMPYDVTTPSQDEYNRYSYSLEDWQKLETAGAVFLPAAGRRSGADQVNTNHYTYYWTSTKETPDKVYYLINCHSLGNDQYKYALPELWHEKAFYGQSVRLVRECIEPEKPQALPSTFSVSATEKVQFSAGNLQYHTGEQVWRFAPEQYDVVGQPNTNIGNPNFKDWVDMFGWSADGKFGVNPSNDQNDYNGEFVDWGKVFSDAKYGISGEEWYTLSMNEWYYLLYTRTNASSLKQVATVGDMIGVLLFPDDWVMPKGFEVNMQTDADGVEYYPYNIDQWKQLEAAGAVFLPAAGRRTGGWGNKKVSPHIEDQENPDNFDSEGYYRWQDNTNYYGYYWTSTKDDSDGRSYFLITCKIGADGETGSPSLPSLWDEEGRYGQSVRLARKLMPLQVVEWKENSVLVMYNGDPAQTATITINNEQKGTTILSDVRKDEAVYELPATGLASSPNQPLEIAIGNAKALMTIPYVATATTTNVVPNNSDLVVLKDATFTATNEQLLRNVTVYGGGKLVVGEGATLSTNSLTLRAGGVTADGNYDYVYPQFVLNGTWTNTSGKINLDYLTTKEQYYTFVAPFAVQTKDIHYPVDIYGSNVAATNTGSFEFQYYDGEARAEGKTGWTVVPEGDDGANLEAGQGYTFLGMPKKINGTRQKYGIHRIPMSVSAADAMSHEKTDQTISVAPHPSAKNNNSGWNLIGNPYMSTIGGLTNENIQVGKLVHTTDANGNWTGGWHWDEETVQSGQRFLVVPSNDGQSYEAVQASNATLHAFKNFFVQISNENATALSIPRKPSAGLLAPARRTEEVVKDVEVAIVLEQDEAHTDQMDFLINNIYTEDFERDADFTKMMNATNLNLYGVHPYDNLSFVAIDNNTARGSVAIGYQVPQAGEYTLRMSDKPYVMFDKIEALYVIDHEMSPEVTTDIMSEAYRFTVANAETNHTRFTVSVILKVEEDDGGGDVGTGVDNTTNNNTPCKFIYQDKMYILRNGVIYDAMGKQVQTINK